MQILGGGKGQGRLACCGKRLSMQIGTKRKQESQAGLSGSARWASGTGESCAPPSPFSGPLVAATGESNSRVKSPPMSGLWGIPPSLGLMPPNPGNMAP